MTLTKRLIAASIVALVIAGMTLFCAAAGGTQWGTMEAGGYAFAGCMLTATGFGIALANVGDLK